MADCQFCKTTPLLATALPVWCIGFPAPASNIYLRYNYVVFPELAVEFFRTANRFTPHARLTLNLAYAGQLIAHEQAWSDFLQTSAPYGAFYENPTLATDAATATIIENMDLPRDWDILIVSPHNYILNRRAARILKDSAVQFHVNLSTYLTAFNLLKVIVR